MHAALIAAATRAARFGDVGGGGGGGSGGPVPFSPTSLRTTGSLSGQATYQFDKPQYLGDRTAISGDPVTDTTIYMSTSLAAVRAGTYTYSGSAGTASQTSAITATAGTYYAWARSSNAKGASWRGHTLAVVIT